MNLQILIWQGELTHSTKWIRGKLKYCESYYKDNKKIVNKLIICQNYNVNDKGGN